MGSILLSKSMMWFSPNEDVQLSDCYSTFRWSITAVLPLLPYTKGSSSPVKDRQGPVYLRMVARMIQVAGVERIMTLDMHSPLIQGFFTMPVDNFSPHSLFETFVIHNVPDWRDSVVVSPDENGVGRAAKIASRLGLAMAVVNKLIDNNNDLLMVTGDVEGKLVLLVDDMVDTCSTLSNAVKLLVKNGAEAIWILITHAILSVGPEDILAEEKVKKFVVTNSVMAPDTCTKEKLVILDATRVLGEGIRRTYFGEALSFDDIM